MPHSIFNLAYLKTRGSAGSIGGQYRWFTSPRKTQKKYDTIRYDRRD